MARVDTASKKEVDPFSVDLNDKATFSKLGFFEQLDACSYAASLADKTGGILLGWVVGAVWFSIQCGIVIALTWFFSTPQQNFYATLFKNVVAYDCILTHHGFETLFRVFSGGNEFNVKYERNSIKEPLFPSIMSSRRSCIDIVAHFLLDASRIWMIVMPSPTMSCGFVYFAATYLVCILDYGEYIGMYGMYHGPWSVFMFAQSAGVEGAISIMQWLLILLYIGCGVGKMGPWFAAVFAQEWTLPPWANKINLRGLFYNKDFPRNNTVTAFATVAAHVAASAEWIAPLLLLLPASVVGGPPGSCSWPVFLGIFIIVAMHLYIVLHIGIADVWALNLVPAFIVYHVFFQSQYLSEPGFDFAGFSALPVPFKAFCLFMLAYCIYGQVFPAKVSYITCYRFWAGNWPQGTVLITESGMKKLEMNFPSHWAASPPGAIFYKIFGDSAPFFLFGSQQNSQFSHRVMPMVLHKALSWSAQQRGEANTPTLAQFKFEQNGTFLLACMLIGWVSGWVVNDENRTLYCMKEMQKVCNFEKGEVVLCHAQSFPLLAHLWNGKSTWLIQDAAHGIVEEGTVTVKEAMSVTKPSVYDGYQSRGDSPSANDLHKKLLGA